MSIQNWGPVRDCMQTEVVEVDGSLDVLQALKVMKQEGTTSLIVRRRDESDEYGMLLFSDIAKKVIAKPVLMVRPDMEIRYCARMFENFGISHAPVSENGKIIGMVSYYRLVIHGLPDLD